MPSCICIALSFDAPLAEIPNGYRKLLNYANEHQWVPTGSILEWYRGEHLTNLDLLLPVTQIAERGGIENG
jgi:effector-binding domain-containing protein